MLQVFRLGLPSLYYLYAPRRWGKMPVTSELNSASSCLAVSVPILLNGEVGGPLESITGVSGASKLSIQLGTGEERRVDNVGTRGVRGRFEIGGAFTS